MIQDATQVRVLVLEDSDALASVIRRGPAEEGVPKTLRGAGYLAASGAG